jgi:hypothetical protein
MQYAFIVTNNQIQAAVQYFDSFGIVFDSGFQGNLAPNGLMSNTVPAGFYFIIHLVTDSNDNVTSAEFTVYGNSGDVATQTIAIPAVVSRFGVTQVPIQAFTLDIVGPFNCANANFSSGGTGFVTYEADNQICVGGALSGSLSTCPPPAPFFERTAESSNISYGFAAPCCGTISQSLIA